VLGAGGMNAYGSLRGKPSRDSVKGTLSVNVSPVLRKTAMRVCIKR
jgi:hypothetical protein